MYLACFLRPDLYGRIKPFQYPCGIGLDGIKGNVLVFLGMSPIPGAVKKGPIGLQDMINPVLEGLDKGSTAALKLHPPQI